MKYCYEHTIVRLGRAPGPSEAYALRTDCVDCVDERKTVAAFGEEGVVLPSNGHGAFEGETVNE